MEYDFIIEALTKELEENGENANVLKERGRLKLMKGDHEGAMEDLKRAVTLNPGILDEITGDFRN